MIRENAVEQTRAADIEALCKTLWDFMKLVTPEEYGTAWETLSEDVIGVGMGEQGYYTNKNEMRAIYGDVQKAAGSETPETNITVELENIDIRFFSPDCATVNADVYIISEANGNTVRNGVKQFASAGKINGKWQFTMLSAVPLTLSEKGIEAYPFKFADNTLAQLKGEIQTDMFDLMNKSFSGGILGTYFKENYPLYFANNALIEMLGYGREEFERKFKYDTLQLNAVNDMEHIRKVNQIIEKSDEDFSSRSRFVKKDGSFIWVEFRTRKTKDDDGNEIFLSVVMDITEIVELHLKAEEQNKTILESISYASKIQRNLLPSDRVFDAAFSDYSVIWKPRDIVGGDIYWLKSYDDGAVLCVADCTGHGTPGALLTMLVAGALASSVTEKIHRDTAQILYSLDQRLAAILNAAGGETSAERGVMDIDDGCDFAVLFIAKDGGVTFSSGHTNVFVCDGKSVQRFKGQQIFVGEGKLKSKSEVEVYSVSANPDNKFYIASDGLYDQPGGSRGKSFGLKTLQHIMLEYHNEKQSVITEKIWAAFEEYRGAEPRVDDFELITFQP
jgi:PAS domain S-box-containing protein